MKVQLIKGLEKVNKDDVIVLCLPHAGGGASFFNSWSKFFDKPYLICPVQLPGREERFLEPPIESINDIAEEIVNAILEYKNKLVLFGHSMGTKMVFEVERLLERNNRKAEVAIVSACPPPDKGERNKLSRLSDDEFLEAIINYDGTPEALIQNRDLMKMFLPTLKADFRLSEEYQCKDSSPLECPIIALGADGDADASEKEIMAWADYTSKDFKYQMFEGNHFYIKDREDEVLCQIKKWL